MAEFGEIPHQNSAIAMGFKSLVKAYCSNLGAEHSPEPAGGFIAGLSKISNKFLNSFC
jgi:hypothetical protein